MVLVLWLFLHIMAMQTLLRLWLWHEHMRQPLYEYSFVSPLNAVDIISGADMGSQVGFLHWNPHSPCCVASCTLSFLSMPLFPHRWCWNHAGTLVWMVAALMRRGSRGKRLRRSEGKIVPGVTGPDLESLPCVFLVELLLFNAVLMSQIITFITAS